MFFGPGYIQRVMFAFVVCTLLGLLVDGLWLGATDYGTLKTLTWFEGKTFGDWAFPFVALVGFLAALPQMLVWDYSFFHSLGAAGALIRLFLSAILSIGFVWGFATMLWPIIAQVFVAIVRGVTSLFSRFI